MNNLTNITHYDHPYTHTHEHIETEPNARPEEDIPIIKQCLLCLHDMDDCNDNAICSNKHDFYMNCIQIFRFNCSCIVNVHKSCMKNWMSHNMKCPICLTIRLCTMGDGL